jgi:hypothetical protein
LPAGVEDVVSLRGHAADRLAAAPDRFQGFGRTVGGFVVDELSDVVLAEELSDAVLAELTWDVSVPAPTAQELANWRDNSVNEQVRAHDPAGPGRRARAEAQSLSVGYEPSVASCGRGSCEDRTCAPAGCAGVQRGAARPSGHWRRCWPGRIDGLTNTDRP